MRRLVKLWRDRAGSSAAEFALVLPIFVALTVGTVNLCLLFFANTLLHYTVADAARCMSVKTAVCTSPSVTQTYALSHYKGPVITPTFTATAAACGSSVSATASFPLITGLVNLTVPMSASACFPK